MTTTAEVVNMISLSAGTKLYGFTVYTDRKEAKSGLTRGRKVGTIVSDTLPNLLRETAQLIEQEGGDWDGLVKFMGKK